MWDRSSHSSRRAVCGLFAAVCLIVVLPLSALADEPAAAPAASAAAPHGVYDFCYMPARKEGSSKYEKWKVVVFELGGKDVAMKPERELDEKGNAIGEHHIFRNAGLFSDVRDAFAGAFPLPRFYAVETETESPVGLRGKKQVADKEMIDAAGLDTFAAYSIACTDWVFLPRLTEKTADWRKVTEKRQDGSVHQKWTLDVSWQMETDIYRHESKGGFTLFATVKDGNSAATDAAYGLAMAAPQNKNMVSQQMLVSKRPKPGCNPPLVAEAAAIVRGGQECLAALGTLADHSRAALQADDSESNAAPPAPPVTPSPGTADGGAPASVDGGVPPAPPAPLEIIPLNPREKALLKNLGDADPDAVTALNELLTESKAQRLLDLANEIKSVKNICEKTVDAVETAADKLRELSQHGLASVGPDAVLGLAQCLGIDLAPDLSSASAPGSQQWFSKHCEHVDDDVAHGRDAMVSVARCRGRVKTEWATLNMQKGIKQQEPFLIFGLLQARPGLEPSQGILLGKDVGAKRGDMYVAQDDDGGFGRLFDNDGEKSNTTPFAFKFRKGEAPNGTNMKEHPQVGILLGARPQMSVYALKGKLDTTLAFGGAVEGGYNASKFVPVGDEVWGRAAFGVLVGSKNETFINFELGPEVVKYLAGGFAAYGGLGFSVAYATKSVDVLGNSDSYSGYTFGALLSAGIDYAVAPDWNARLGVAYRQGFNNADLKSDSLPGTIDGGTLSYAQAGLAVLYTY